jgi:outer membrane lipase/esterase
MFRKILASGVSLAILAIASQAQAQQFNRVVVFGDSLSDNGNLYATTGQPPAPYNRRFSNGLVWSEYLFGTASGFTTTGPANVNTGNVNFAFGGARTDTAANSNGPIPGTSTQIGAFAQLGGAFRANDVASLWGGANNLFQGIPGAAANPLTATATMTGIANASAADIGNQTRQLAALGARTIVVFNLPSLAGAPQFAGTAAEQLAGFSSGAFNAALQAQLTAAAASTSANIISIPVDQVFSAVTASPAAFGFGNTRQACLTVAACVTGGAAAQSSYLFWDGVHPTAAGYQIISATVNEYLTAPTRAAAVSTAMGNTAFAARRTAVLDSMGQLSGLSPAPGKWEYFVFATGEAGQSNGSFQNGILASTGVSTGRAAEYRIGGLRFGGLHNLGNGWTIGAMGSVTTGNIDAKARKFEVDATQISLDAIARWRSPTGLFVNLGLGFGIDRFSDYEYRTVGPLKNTGSALGHSLSATTEVGYDMKYGAATLTPQLRASYLRTSLESFNESGVVAPVGYNGRVIQGLAGAAELKLSYQFTPTLSGYVLGGYEGYLASSADAVKGRLLGNTSQPFSEKVADPVSPGVVFGAGATMQFGDWSGRISYRGTVGDKSQVTHSANIGFGVKF